MLGGKAAPDKPRAIVLGGRSIRLKKAAEVCQTEAEPGEKGRDSLTGPDQSTDEQRPGVSLRQRRRLESIDPRLELLPINV